ncbi:hypothetical protein CSPX01_14181, partial [Colletotrichum filicis]
ILLFIGSARTTQGSSSVTLLGSAISQPNLPTSLEAAGLHLIPSPSTQSGRHPFFPAAAQPLSASLSMSICIRTEHLHQVSAFRVLSRQVALTASAGWSGIRCVSICTVRTLTEAGTYSLRCTMGYLSSSRRPSSSRELGGASWAKQAIIAWPARG